MSLVEIKEGIANLPAAELDELLEFIHGRPNFAKLTAEQRAAMQKRADEAPAEAWVKWEDLKVELSQAGG